MKKRESFSSIWLKLITDAKAADEKLNEERPGSGFGGLQSFLMIIFGWVFALYFYLTQEETKQ